jgi:DNA-binding response OmpR family regulator
VKPKEKRAISEELIPELNAIHRLPRPYLVFARDDATGTGKSPSPAAKLLVVEDDFLVASQVEAALRDAGYDVGEVVPSAAAALDAAASHRFTLAVVDIRLAGGLDGVDCALALFTRHGLRSMFATAHYDEDVRRRAEPARPVGWLQKPYTTASLVNAVRAALQKLDDEH